MNALVRKIQGISLLAKANKTLPDPAAASTLIEALNRFYEMKIDTSDLEKEKDRINSEFSELSQKYVEHREEICWHVHVIKTRQILLFTANTHETMGLNLQKCRRGHSQNQTKSSSNRQD